MKRRAFVCALLLAMASHAHAAPYNFDYTTAGAQVMGIDRVFDDGQNTVVAFYGPLGNERPTITTETGSVMGYRVVDRYLVMPGIHRRVLVYARGVVAQIDYGRAPPVHLPQAGYAAAMAAPVPVQQHPQAQYAAPIAAQAQVALPVPPAGAAFPAALAAGPALSAPGPAPAASAVYQTPAGHTVRTGVPVSRLPGQVASIAAKPAGAADPVSDPIADRFIVSDEAPPPPPPAWTAAPGMSLRLTTEQWAKKAGWTVYWNLKNGADYETVAVRADGEFLKALRQLYAPYLQASGDRPVRVAAYPRQSVLVISE